jgi:hypothetical protein
MERLPIWLAAAHVFSSGDIITRLVMFWTEEHVAARFCDDC